MNWRNCTTRSSWSGVLSRLVLALEHDALGVEEGVLGVDGRPEPGGQGDGVGRPGRNGVALAAQGHADLGEEGAVPQLGDDHAVDDRARAR